MSPGNPVILCDHPVTVESPPRNRVRAGWPRCDIRLRLIAPDQDPAAAPDLQANAMSTEVPTSIVRVRSLDSLRGSDAGYAGSKGANLGELMSAGVPVPPGFVIGAPAYAEFCEETGVPGRLDELLGTIDVDDAAALEAA